MSKVFESQSLIDEAAKRKEQYEALEEQLNTLKQAFQGIADLDGDFKGKGADNIKDFFQGQAEIAESWLTLVSSQITFLKGISGEIKDRNLSDSYAETSFLEHEAANGEAKASEMMSAQKSEADSILSGIRDIIALEPYSLDDFADDMSKAQNIRRATITAIEELDHSLTAEYQNLEALDHAVLNKYSVLMQATSNGKSASPMYFDKKAFHSNDIYKGAIEVEKQGAAYIEAKAQQAEARRLKEKQEAEANKPWYEKTWDSICTFTGEISGYYDYKRAAEGIDPVTGETLSAAERITAGAMAAAGFIPVVGWAGRAFKGGKALYKTGKTVMAAEHALDAYKTGKSMDILKMTEMGAYGLAASNGFTEAVTGRDMFGNQVSEEKRKQGALEAALNLVGAGALAKYARKGIPLSTPPKIQKANNILEQIKQFKVPTKVRVYAEQPVTTNGFPIGLPRVRADVEKTAVKDFGIVKMVGNGGNRSLKTIAYKLGFDEHLIKVEGFSQKKGVIGGHNLDEFYGYLKKEGIPINELSRTPHENIKGVYEIEYQIPARDSAGNIVEGEWKKKPFTKTVIDPREISNEKIIELGKEAMEEGIGNHRIVKQNNSNDIIEGKSSNGLKFKGYRNPENGEILNYHPVLEW
ncbi:EndoU domain-containing protein [Bacillus sp. YC2]|nr:T7SS effector LXG polymorphic toxin [Bacillus sp. YC2]MBY8911649.1 EndoU domain-containing protein [Bacillus sp. YC2]